MVHMEFGSHFNSPEEMRNGFGIMELTGDFAGLGFTE